MRFKKAILFLPLSLLLFGCKGKTTTKTTVNTTSRTTLTTKSNTTTVDNSVNVVFVDDTGTVLLNERVEKGSTIKEISIDEKEGKEFKGWFHNGEAWNFEDVINEDLVLVNWSNKVYSLKTFTTCRESDSFGYTSDYTYQSTVTVYDYSHFLFHKFGGWYEDGKLVSTNSIYTFNMPARDLILEASYHPIGDLDKFDFEVYGSEAFLTATKEDAVFGDNVVIPEGVISISNVVTLNDDDNHKMLVLPDSLRTLRNYAFSNISVDFLVIGKGLSRIDKDVFKDSEIHMICFTGTEEEWNSIVKDENATLAGVKVYFYSENEPEEKNKYWHYINEYMPAGGVIIWR